MDVAVIPDGLTVEVDGAGTGVPSDERHLVVRALRRAFAAFGESPSGLHLRCRNAIPHARGLGSSAAAVVAGAAAAAVLAGRDVAAERDALLQITAGMEGHADNAAASLYGGFVVAWNNDDRFDAVRIDADPRILPVAFVPEVESSTATTQGPPPRRFRSRMPHSPEAAPRSPFSPSPAVLICSCPPPRTDCTRSTGDRHTRSRRIWSTRCARRAFRQ